MFCSYDQLRDIFRCSYCQANFEDVVKVIPDCGQLVCGHCAAELKSALNNKRQFKCKACKQLHILPKSGLAEMKPIMDALKLKPERKALPVEAEALKNRMEEVQSRINRLKRFDAKEEVNSYCDQLQVQVLEAVESSIQLLNKQGDELIKQINDYRQRLLAGNPSSTADFDDSMDVDVSFDAELNEEARSRPSPEERLRDLAAEMAEFGEEWEEFFTQISKAPSSRDIQQAQEEIDCFESKLGKLNDRFMRHAFSKDFLKFRPNNQFFKPTNHLGELVSENSAKGHRLKTECLRTIETEVGEVNKVLFLRNGYLATCGREKSIKVWNPITGKLLHELNGHVDSVQCLAQLENGWLASGSRDKSIRLWELNAGEAFSTRKLAGHTDFVFALKTLPNGTFASCSWDDTIKIWNPYLVEGNLLLTITGHGIKECSALMDVLPNGNLITCSDEPDQENTLRVWDSKNGELIKSIRTESRDACSLLVLADERVAVGFCNSSTISIIDLNNAERSLKLKQMSFPASLMLLSNGTLLSSDSDPSNKIAINFWNAREGQLVQTVPTEHTKEITSLSISPNGKFLASGSTDKTVKIWFLADKSDELIVLK